MIGQHTRNFALAPYKSEWIDQFDQETELLRSVLGKKALRIEHIGSTSIPGMAAKPIIDIMVAVASLVQSSEIILALDSIDYVYRPVDTVPGRMFFRKESQPEIRTHHLNLTQEGSSFWKNQLRFRDYLRKNDQLASEYIQLKECFVEYYARTNHLDLEWKTDFVTKVLALAKDDKKD
jgi:GrpB-like predicted nucleotidyltransferase (UPF0157 family)